MKKHIAFLLLIALVFGMAVSASAVQVKDIDITTADRTIKSAPTMRVNGRQPVSVYLDGVQIDTEGYSYIVEDEVYVPFIEFCEKVGLSEVQYDERAGKITVTGDGIDISISSNKPYYTVNGRVFLTKNLITSFHSSVLLSPLKELCRLYGVEWGWNGVTNSVRLKSGINPIISGDKFYNEKDLYWMSHIIEAEAGVECFDGKIAVGNVIMNRVAKSEFPNSIYGVIFDRRSGIQFSPAYSGSIYKTPRADAVAAAKLVLEGVVVVKDAIYFQPNYRADICWAGRNRPYVATIDGHTFWR